MTNFSRELKNIEADLVKMGEAVAGQLEQVKDILLEEHTGPDVQRLLEKDNDIDAFDRHIHTSILHLISLQPPLPEELQALTTMMRMAREFERIGDQVVNIAELKTETGVEALKHHVSATFADGYMRMQQVSMDMLARTLEGMQSQTYSADERVEQMDENVDELFSDLQQQVIRDMKANPQQLEKVAPLFLAIRYVERIADHVVNINRRLDGYDELDRS